MCAAWTLKQKCSCCHAKRQWCEGPHDASNSHVPPSSPILRSSHVVPAQTVRQSDEVQVQSESQSSQDVISLSNTIKQLEATLKQLPLEPSFANVRNTVNDGINSCKKKITQSKPLSSQLASCHAALSRANALKEKAAAKVQQVSVDFAIALSEATSELENCSKDVVTLESESLSLEMQVATSGPNKSSINSLSAACEDVINDMRVSGNVNGAIIDEAMLKMKQLLQGIQTVAIETKVAKDNALAAASPTKSHGRKRASSQPPVTSPLRDGHSMPEAAPPIYGAVGRRLSGKTRPEDAPYLLPSGGPTASGPSSVLALSERATGQ